MSNAEEWRPGSFTKNFSWGQQRAGLFQLYETIKLGFADTMDDVRREQFRQRVTRANRPDYIPINFFLFNKIIDGVDYIVADELVFQALTTDHSPRFDKLALFAFNFSFVGKWKGASPYQRRPALWAYHYIKDRVAEQFHWDTASISANDIEKFVVADPRYRAQTARKLATNLNYLYGIGRLSEYSDRRVERWWVDALFLALDRLIEDRRLDGFETSSQEYGQLLTQSGFQTIGGQSSLEKDLARRHLLALYVACGGRNRFSDEAVKEQTKLELPDAEWLEANDPRPQGAVHVTNPRILKNIPRVCAMLARYAGFEIIDADELASFDPEDFIRKHTKIALQRLQADKIIPTMSAEELTKLTREKCQRFWTRTS
jgi:hypothetical protein